MRSDKTVTISISTANAAFDGHECGEVARILRTFCREIANNYTHLPIGQNGLYDISGNTCGRVDIVRND